MRFGILFGLVSVCGLAAAAANPLKWSFRTSATPRVSVSTISGSITAVAADGNDVGVEATVTGGDEADRAQWVVDVQKDGDAVRARACCGPCDAPRARCNSRADVSFVVRLPPGAQLSATSVSGDIHASGLRRRQTLTTVSGDVDWSGLCASDCRLHATTVSGDVKLALAQASSFGLEYGSVSGSFKDELATNVTEKGRSRVRASYGKAEGAIACQTVSGDLALERK